MTKIGVDENVGEKINNEKTDKTDEEVDEILAPSGFANPAYPPPQGPAVDPYAAPQAGVPAYAQPPPAPQSLAPSPQPVIINIQQNASSQNLAQTPPQAPRAFGHENVYCKCPFCGHQGMTVIDKRVGNFAWQMCFLILILMPPCCCLPFCIPAFMDTYHYCAMCKQQVGSKT